jgi:hypothetical protein
MNKPLRNESRPARQPAQGCAATRTSRMRRPKRTGRKATDAAADGKAAIQMGKRLEAIEAWQDALADGPKFKGVVDLYAPKVEAIALKCNGYSAFKLIMRLARAGHPKAISDLVRLASGLAQALEDTARLFPKEVQALAAPLPHWPVMLCRHEVSNKLIAAYLDDIGLGAKCAINADGQRIAKYSLRTPINRFVWRKLAGLPLSVAMMSDIPKVAAIDLDALPKLTKATAKLWADKALMPYVTAMYENFYRVPEFPAILRRPGVRTRGQQRREIRKDIIRALQSLAPPT